jgi:hypothetical protein
MRTTGQHIAERWEPARSFDPPSGSVAGRLHGVGQASLKAKGCSGVNRNDETGLRDGPLSAALIAVVEVGHDRLIGGQNVKEFGLGQPEPCPGEI